MSVYLVTRSHYAGPAGKSVRRYPEASVLEWFQTRWNRRTPEEREELALFLWVADGEEWPPRPESPAELAAVLQEHGGTQGDILFSPRKPHLLQALDDDDELEFAHYLFDDTYRAAHPAETAFLLHDDWRLPEAVAATPPDATALRSAKRRTHPVRPAGRGAGSVFLVFLTAYDSAHLSDLEGPDEYGGPFRLGGLRLPDLLTHLTAHEPKGVWPFELLLLRTVLTRAAGSEAAPTLADLLARTGRLPIGTIAERIDSEGWFRDAAGAQRTIADALDAATADNGAPSAATDDAAAGVYVQDTPHLAQACYATGDVFGNKTHDRWVFFDDLWLAAHPALGAALLRYAARWDVLS